MLFIPDDTYCFFINQIIGYSVSTEISGYTSENFLKTWLH